MSNDKGIQFMNRQVPKLIGAKTVLRLAVKDDVEAIIDFYLENAKHFEKFASPKDPAFYSSEFWTRKVAESQQEFHQDKSCNLFIFDKLDPTRIHGFVSFFGIIRGSFHACIMGYSLAEKSEGKGLMTDALGTAIDYMFNTLNFHRIMANHAPMNTRSANLLRRLKFVPEGYARDYLLVNGKWQDHVLTALTNEQWKSSV